MRDEIKTTFLTNVIYTLLQIAALSIIARVLGPAGQGLFALAILIPTMLSIFLGLGQTSVNVVFCGLYKSNRQNLFLQSVVITIAGSIISALIILSFFFWLPINIGQFRGLSTAMIWIIILIFPLRSFSILLISLLRGTGQINRSAYINAFSAAVYVFGLIVLLIFFRGDTTTAILVYALYPLVTIIVSLFYLSDIVTFDIRQLSIPFFKSGFVFGFLSNIGEIATYLVYRLNQVILAYMVTPEQVGVYVIAVYVAEQLRLLPTAVSSVFLPRLANESAVRQSQVPSVFRYALIISFFAMLIVAIIGPGAILIVFGKAYIGSILPFLVLLPGIVVLGGSSIVSSDLLVRKKPHYASMVSGMSLFLNLGLNFVFIPLWGITGAALASTITYLIAFVVAVLIFRKESKTMLRDMIPQKNDFIFIATALKSLIKESLLFGTRILRLRMPKTENSSKNQSRHASIVVVGTLNWVDNAASLCKLANFNAIAFKISTYAQALKFILTEQFRTSEAIYQVGGGGIKYLMLAVLFRKKLIKHWIGSDAYSIRQSRGWRRKLQLTMLKRCVDLHCADSPQVASVLAEMGIFSEVVRLLPAGLLGDVLPLPEKFTVLGYWPDKDIEKYGGHHILRLAREFPDIRFLIVQATGENVEALPNVTFLGFQKDMAEVFRQTSVLVRILEHDSISALALEMLARGRYVIYTHPLPGSIQVSSYEEAKNALEKLRYERHPNIANVETIRKQFAPELQAKFLGKLLCEKLHIGPMNINPQ